MRCALLSVLFMGACGHDALDTSADMSGIQCAALGASCVATDVSGACPSGGQKLDFQENYCGGDATKTQCCLPPCPAYAEAALGQPCAGPRVCEYVDTCAAAVCQPTNGFYSWFVYTRPCP